MFEDIYRIYTGENLKTDDWKIPADTYEKIMTTYFPVSIEQLREKCGFTLVVDGVWADYNSDLAFTNIIVVQPFADGTFRYLSNSIEQKELEVPKAGR